MTHESEKGQGGGIGGGRVTPQFLQSALDAQIRDLAEQELDSLKSWYQELGSILDDVEQVRTRIRRFREWTGNRITELEPELERGQ